MFGLFIWAMMLMYCAMVDASCSVKIDGGRLVVWYTHIIETRAGSSYARYFG